MPYNSLRPIRERKGLTVAQLAGKTSISIRTLQTYEAGERTIAPDDLRKLSRILFATPAEILQLGEPPPPAPPPVAKVEIPVAPPVVTSTITVLPAPPAVPIPPAPEPLEAFPRRPFTSRFRDAPGPASDGPGAPRPRPPRPQRESRPPRPPGPASAGQIDQIRHLARRMGLDDAAVVERIGAPLETLDHGSARVAIARLRQDLEESGNWQPRVGEGPDHEGEYLARLRDRRLPLDVRLITGERVGGIVEDFTAYVIRLRNPDDGSDVSVRKLAIAYYQTQGPVDDPE